ncbi:MAG: enoyl-CoA hydratase, partial [Candidatus Rokuibacteriota bacterium]
MQQTVTYAVADGVGWITLNRPAVLNALDSQLATGLADAAEAAAA